MDGIQFVGRCLILLVFFVSITKFKTVESSPLGKIFSSTSHKKDFKLNAERLSQHSSTNDNRTIAVNSNVIRFCASINSIRWAGHSWGVSNVAKYSSVKIILGSPKTWFVWQVRISNRIFYMFGLKSMEQEGKFHFVRNQGNRNLILSKPQSQPTSNLQNTDSRLFEVLSSTDEERSILRNPPFNHLTLRHEATDSFIIESEQREILLKKNMVDLVGHYRFTTDGRPATNNMDCH